MFPYPSPLLSIGATAGGGGSYASLSPYYTDPTIAVTSSGTVLTKSSVSSNGITCSRDAQSSGKWYFEVTWTSGAATIVIGVQCPTGTGSALPSLSPNPFGLGTYSGLVYGNSGNIFTGTGGTPANSGQSIGVFSVGDVIGVAVDLNASTVSFNRNGGAFSTAVAITASKLYVPWVGFSGASSVVTANFGASAFAHSPPAGFVGWPSSAVTNGRYWRVQQYSNPTRAYTHFQEIELRGSAGGSDLTLPAGTITAAATGTNAAYAFDNNFATGYEDATTAQSWVQYDFGSATAVKEMMFAVRQDYNDYSSELLVLNSNDGTTFYPAFAMSLIDMTRAERRVFSWDTTFTRPTQTEIYWNSSDSSPKYTFSSPGHTATKITTDAEDSMFRCIKGIPSSGKGYFECIVVDSSTSPGAQVGVANSSAALTNYLGFDANGWAYHMSDGHKFNNGGSVAYSSAWVDGDIIGVAYNNGSLWFAKNGTWVGDPVAGTGAAFTGITGTAIYPAAGLYRQASPTQKLGIRGNSDNLTYSPPSGYLPWGQA